MLLQSPILKRAAPLLVGSGSCVYAIVRARNLSTSEADDASIVRFLVDQSDMILLLFGGPVVWYVSQRRHHVQLGPTVHGPAARAIHQLRQIFSALLLGTELLERKAATADRETLQALSERLNSVVREGIAELSKLGEPHTLDLID